MADENINIEVSGFQSLKAQIKEANLEYQKLLNDVNASPAAISAAAAKVGSLKDELGDAADSAKALGSAAGQFSAFTKGISAISGGFTALQGAIGLAGGNAKDFEKTIAKVQSAMALTQGLSALSELGDAFGNMKKVAVNAFQAIKGAIGATGIGLLVVALGTIYAYWDDIKGAVSGVSKEQEDLNALTKANLDAEQGKLDSLNGQDNVLKLQGKSEKDILKLKIGQTDQVIAANEAQITQLEVTKKAQVDAAKRNKDILQGIIRFLTAPLTLLLSTVDSVGKALGQDFGLEEKFSGGLAKMIFDPEEVASEGDKAIEEAKKANAKLKNDRAGLQLQLNAIDQKAADEAKSKRDATAKQQADDLKKSNEEQQKIQEDHLKKTKELKNQFDVDSLADQQAKDRLALEQKQKTQTEELDLLIKGYQDKKNLTAEEKESLAILLEEQKQLRLTQAKETDNLLKAQAEQAQKDKEAKDKENFDKEMANLQDSQAQKRAELDKQYADGLIKLEEYQQKQRELDIAALQENLALAQQNNQDTTAAEEAYYAKLAELRQQDADADKAANEQKKQDRLAQIQGALTAANDIVGAVGAVQEMQMAKDLKAAGDNAAAQEAIKKEYFEKNKKVQIAQAIIAAIQGAIGAFTSMAAIPVVGPVLGGIAAAAALVTGYANVEKIKATQYQSSTPPGGSGGAGGGTTPPPPPPREFADGGYVSGPGTGKSDSISARLSNGESVINAQSTKMYSGLLSAINVAGGGKAFANGGIATNNPVGQTTMNTPIIKTYVVASDMTNQQEADAKIKRLAQL